MKKILITILIIGLITFNINAEEYVGETDILLTYKIEPTYSIKIPKSLDISNNETTFNYYVLGDIYADQTLNILFDSKVEIKDKTNTYEASISQNKTTWTQSELSNNYVSSAVSISHNKLKAGNYIGILNVAISLLGGTR
ncbi:MAG: hypothetical protein Q4E99_06225 [Bacillota bacterium]|nr:hypothetical protein [Bacillota bacterium]